MSDKPLTITLKYGTGPASPWAVFNGSLDEIRENVLKFLGLPESWAEGKTLHEIVYAGGGITAGLLTLESVLGATFLDSGPVDEAEPTKDKTDDNWPPSRDDVWDKVDQPAPAAEQVADDPHARVLKEIQAAPSIDRLKRIWVDNKALCSESDELRDAYKARGQVLKNS